MMRARVKNIAEAAAGRAREKMAEAAAHAKKEREEQVLNNVLMSFEDESMHAITVFCQS